MKIYKITIVLNWNGDAYKLEIHQGRRWYIRDVMSGKWLDISNRRPKDEIDKLEKEFAKLNIEITRILK